MERILLESLIEEGLSQRQIGERVGKSQGCVKHWLHKFQLKTKVAQYNENPALRPYKCKHCGEGEEEKFMNKGRGRRCRSLCKECHTKLSVERWRKRKQRAIQYKGSQCHRCGYDKCDAALEFHHRDSKEKDKSFSANFVKQVSWEKVRQELDKCDLVCANCHREIHWTGV